MISLSNFGFKFLLLPSTTLINNKHKTTHFDILQLAKSKYAAGRHPMNIYIQLDRR